MLFAAATLLPIAVLCWLGVRTLDQDRDLERQRRRERLEVAAGRVGKPVPATPLEFRLLTLFVTRPDRVLTRRILIDEAWGRDTAITERVVDNQIANLRKKIESSTAEPRFLKACAASGTDSTSKT